MLELSQTQSEILQRLFDAGFRPVAISPYEKALCVHRGESAALLAPAENGTWKLLAPVTLLVGGNLSVRLKKPSGDVFVWKNTELPATLERLRHLEKFHDDLLAILESRKL